MSTHERQSAAGQPIVEGSPEQKTGTVLSPIQRVNRRRVARVLKLAAKVTPGGYETFGERLDVAPEEMRQRANEKSPKAGRIYVDDWYRLGGAALTVLMLDVQELLEESTRGTVLTPEQHTLRLQEKLGILAKEIGDARGNDGIFDAAEKLKIRKALTDVITEAQKLSRDLEDA